MDSNLKYIIQEDWDPITNTHRPAGESPNWYTRTNQDRYYYTFGKYMFERVTDFEEMLYKPIPGFEYIQKDKINDVDKYIYVVRIYEPMYFFLQDKLGLDFLTLQIKQDIISGKCKLIFLSPFEGYSGIKEFVTGNDFKIIQRWIKESSLPSDNVYYINANLKSTLTAEKDGCRVNIIPVTMGETFGNVFTLPESIAGFNPIDENYLFTYYSRRPRTHRNYIGASLIRENLFDLGRISFNALEPYNKYELELLDPEIIPFVDQLYSKSPLYIDKDNSGDDITLHTPLIDYSSTFIHLIGETLYSNDTLFFSEKTWKPISMGVPFITVSSPGSLEWLRSQGFKTFDKWIDESYDKELDPGIRFDKVIDILKYLSNKSIQELKAIRAEMYPICEHNKQVIKERTKSLYYYSDGTYDQRKATTDKIIQIYNNEL